MRVGEDESIFLNIPVGGSGKSEGVRGCWRFLWTFGPPPIGVLSYW